MDQAQWKTAIHPDAMLEIVKGKPNERGLRLFAIACCRRIRHAEQPYFQNALLAMERLLGQQATGAEVIAARDELQRVADRAAAEESDETAPLQRFDWNALSAFRAACDSDGTYLSSPSVMFFAKGETEPGTAYSAAVYAAMSAAQSIATQAANLLEDASEDQRVDQFMATEASEQAWQAQVVREIFGNPYEIGASR